MYLSSIPVDTGPDPNRPRPGRKWVENPYRIHQRLCMGFDGRMPPSGERKCSWFLFRLEGPIRTGQGMRPRLLVQSRIEPDWDAAFRNAPFMICDRPAVRPYAPRFAPRQVLRFLLRANPTVSRKREGSTKGRRAGITAPEDQFAWLDRKAAAGGFAVVDASITSVGWQYSRRSRMLDTQSDKQPLRTHLAVTYDGFLQVLKDDLFRWTIQNGIGSAKAFGFGLLSVAPVH